MGFYSTFAQMIVKFFSSNASSFSIFTYDFSKMWVIFYAAFVEIQLFSSLKQLFLI